MTISNTGFSPYLKTHPTFGSNPQKSQKQEPAAILQSAYNTYGNFKFQVNDNHFIRLEKITEERRSIYSETMQAGNSIQYKLSNFRLNPRKNKNTQPTLESTQIYFLDSDFNLVTTKERTGNQEWNLIPPSSSEKRWTNLVSSFLTSDSLLKNANEIQKLLETSKSAIS